MRLMPIDEAQDPPLLLHHRPPNKSGQPPCALGIRSNRFYCPTVGKTGGFAPGTHACEPAAVRGCLKRPRQVMLFLWSSDSQRHVKLACKIPYELFLRRAILRQGGDQASGRTTEQVAILLIAETGMALLVLHSASALAN
jgi:hypothetical protein